MKRALLVGINYPGTTSQLNGCVNDVVLMSEVLTDKFGFTDPLNRRMLTDASATTYNILERLKWLVSDVKAGDTLFFHYSGHGSQMVDTDYDTNEEPDFMDEIICPIDLDWREKVIKDDDFKKIFSSLPEGVNLTVILDCCHSGQGLRAIPPALPFNTSYTAPTPNKSKFIPCPPDIANRALGIKLDIRPRLLEEVSVIEEQQGILISGCKSTQTSADAWIHTRYHGACTYYMCDVLRDNNWNIPYVNLVRLMNIQLEKAGYEQRPELNCSSKWLNKEFLAGVV